MIYSVLEDDIIKLLDSAVKLTVHETVAELRKSGFLTSPDKMAYKVAAQKIQEHFAALKAGEQGDSDVDIALRAISRDEYRNILRLYYYNGMTIEQIAEVYDCDPCTITRNKKRLCLEVQKKLQEIKN